MVLNLFSIFKLFYFPEGCTIAEFDRGNNTCRLYKSNCKQSENCILKQAAYKTLTFVKKTGITTVSPKLSDNENKNDVTNAIDTTNSAARIENVKESDNHSNATINATLNSSNKHAIVSNITNNRMDNGTELNPSKSSSNKTEGVKSEINSTDSSVNTTAETSLQSLSNKTNAWSTVPSSIKETNEIQTAHNDAHITSTAAYVNNATNITPAAQNANNATNKTIDQHVNNSTLTKSVTAYVNNATDETKTVPKPTTGSPTQTSGMGKLDNQSSVVTTEVTEIPSVNYTVSSNNVQNKTNNISSIHIANTTTSAPENITGIGININVTTTPFAANSANGTATEKANHELLPSGTNETMKQRNMTVQSLVNTTSNPLSASEKTTKVSPDTAEGTTGLVHTTESPVHNVSRTTTATNNTTVSHRNENISSTTLDHGGTTIPVTNTTKVSTNKDGFSKPNLTSTITISEGEKSKYYRAHLLLNYFINVLFELLVHFLIWEHR